MERKKQQEICNASKKKIRKTLEGRTKKQEESSKAMKVMCKNIRFDRESAFDEVKGRSMVDPSILNTNVYKIIERTSQAKLMKVLNTCVIYVSAGTLL